ncbi:MAG: ankyrin repeat domain-containing protein [Candidatus Heimdallarchaeota archaeon]|nr:ankyrin repeat domain-containing protein [Candidatus Heimdallarchaeota archaeon]
MDIHLISLAGLGFVEEAKLFLQQGADLRGVDRFGRNALYRAARSESIRRVEMVEFLISRGAVLPAGTDLEKIAERDEDCKVLNLLRTAVTMGETTKRAGPR